MSAETPPRFPPISTTGRISRVLLFTVNMQHVIHPLAACRTIAAFFFRMGRGIRVLMHVSSPSPSRARPMAWGSLAHLFRSISGSASGSGGVRRLVRQVRLAGKQAQERSALALGVIAHSCRAASVNRAVADRSSRIIHGVGGVGNGLMRMRPGSTTENRPAQLVRDCSAVTTKVARAADELA